MFDSKVLFPLIIGAMFFGGLAWNHMQRKRLLRVGKTVTATVMDVEIRSLPADSDTRAYERRFIYTLYYAVNGANHTGRFESRGEEPLYSTGEPIDIVYNPDNPKDMRPASHMGNIAPRRMGAFILIGAVLLGFILYFLLYK